jgi:hypothetical protein
MQLLKAIACQLIGFLISLLLVSVTATPGMVPFVACQAISASAASFALRQPAWWVPIHLLFAPAALTMLTLQLPSWLYLLAVLMLGLVFWGTIKGDVPLFLSSTAVNDALKIIVDHEQAQSFIDLGAGIGSVTSSLAAQRPEMTVEAWERAPIPWLLAKWRSRNQQNCSVIRKSFWDCDLSIYDVVFAFLSPAPMPQLGEKALREMHPGSMLISSTFPVPEWEPESILTLEDAMRTTLYCYRIE